MSRIRLNSAQVTATAQRRALPLVQLTTQQVLAAAKRMAPKGSGLSGSGKRKRGRALRPSITSSMQVGPQRILGRVGSTAAHAATVHEGSKPHTIYARGKMLKFQWPRGDFLLAARQGRRGGNKRTGRFHYFVRVRHPGNKRPIRYLTTPLMLFGRANGFVVIKSLQSTLYGQRTRLP